MTSPDKDPTKRTSFTHRCLTSIAKLTAERGQCNFYPLIDPAVNPETIAILTEGLYLADPVDAPVGEDYSINHSCEPNLWMVDAITLSARRKILPAEELTVDYALWLYDVDWMLDPCKCGSRLCRGRIAGQDWQRRDLQARYKGHFTPILNRMISEARDRGVTKMNDAEKPL